MKPDAHDVDAATKPGMDAFMSSNEESFEDFLSSFINPADSQVLAQLSSAKNRFNSDRPVPPERKSMNSSNGTARQSKEKSASEEEKEEIEIEEVPLDNENRSGGICASGFQKRPTFDNFVLLESDVEDEEEMADPSFSSYLPTVADSPQCEKTLGDDLKKTVNSEEQNHPNGACSSGTDVEKIEDVSDIALDSCGTEAFSRLEGDPSLIENDSEESRRHASKTVLDASLVPSVSGTPTVSRLPSSDNPDNEASEMVQPFSLDEDFDYDNVVLSVKYTAEEVRSFRK